MINWIKSRKTLNCVIGGKQNTAIVRTEQTEFHTNDEESLLKAKKRNQAPGKIKSFREGSWKSNEKVVQEMHH